MGTMPTSSLPQMEGGSDSSVVLRHDTQARFWIAIVIIAQFVLLIAYVSYRTTPLADSQLIIGSEIALVSTVINFYFGSSSGSTAKGASQSTEKHAPP